MGGGGERFYPKIGRFFLLVVCENKGSSGSRALEISWRKSSPLRWKYPGGGAIQNLVSETLPKLHFIEAIRSAPHRDWLALIMPLWEGGRTGSPRSQQSASIFHDADPPCVCVCVWNHENREAALLFSLSLSLGSSRFFEKSESQHCESKLILRR